MEDRSCIIKDFRPLGTADHPDNAITTLAGVFDGHLSAKAAEMAANNLHEHLIKGSNLPLFSQIIMSSTVERCTKTTDLSVICPELKLSSFAN